MTTITAADIQAAVARVRAADPGRGEHSVAAGSVVVAGAHVYDDGTVLWRGTEVNDEVVTKEAVRAFLASLRARGAPIDGTH